MSKKKSINILVVLSVLLLSSCHQKKKEISQKEDKQQFNSPKLELEKTEDFHGLPELPKSIDFAGEKIPMENEDVRDRLMRELVVQVNFHSRTLLMLRALGKWEDLIRSELVKNDMPEDFLYLAIAESELKNEITSRKGAAGMWQFMPESGREVGLIVNEFIDQRRDPVLATKAAAIYLKESKTIYGSWVGAAASYNRGRRGLSNAMEGQGQKNYFELFLNEETSRYVFRILAMKLVYGNPEKYGFKLSKEDKQSRFKFKLQELESGEYSTVKLASKYGVTFKTLKEYNPWLRDTRTYKLKTKKNLTLYLPL